MLADEGAGMPMGSESCMPEPVPKGAAPEVAKVLQASSWYAVLEVSSNATVEEVRKAHKVKSLVTHPDKLGAQNRGAHEASVRVNMVRPVCQGSLSLSSATLTSCLPLHAFLPHSCHGWYQCLEPPERIDLSVYKPGPPSDSRQVAMLSEGKPVSQIIMSVKDKPFQYELVPLREVKP